MTLPPINIPLAALQESDKIPQINALDPYSDYMQVYFKLGSPTMTYQYGVLAVGVQEGLLIQYTNGECLEREGCIFGMSNFKGDTEICIYGHDINLYLNDFDFDSMPGVRETPLEYDPGNYYVKFMNQTDLDKVVGWFSCP